MPPEEMTGSTHILEFMCYANSRFRRDKIPHGNGDDIFFRCFGSATPGLGRAAPRRAPRFRGSGSPNAGGFAVAGGSIAKICGAAGGPPADD